MTWVFIFVAIPLIAVLLAALRRSGSGVNPTDEPIPPNPSGTDELDPASEDSDDFESGAP